MSFDPYLIEIVERVLGPDAEDRELYRLYAYLEHYGPSSINWGSAGVAFVKPECAGGWDCVTPEHQRLEVDL